MTPATNPTIPHVVLPKTTDINLVQEVPGSIPDKGPRHTRRYKNGTSSSLVLHLKFERKYCLFFKNLDRTKKANTQKR